MGGIVVQPEHLTAIALIISVVSLLYTIYKNSSNTTTENTAEMTTVIVKLENIGNGIGDIKSEIASLKDDQRDDHDRLIRAETSLASAWKRINELSNNGGNINE